MKRASYRAAIWWIAENDEAGADDAFDERTASELVTACLIADLFDIDSARVGRDIVRARKRQAKTRAA